MNKMIVIVFMFQLNWLTRLAPVTANQSNIPPHATAWLQHLPATDLLGKIIFNKATRETVSVNDSDVRYGVGLAGRATCQGVVGRFYFGATGGLTAFDSNEITDNIDDAPSRLETALLLIFAFTIMFLLLGVYVYWRVTAGKEREQRLAAMVADRTLELTNRINALEESNASLVQAHERAEAASRAKSAFLTTMSHELRTPLNAILGFSTLLEKGGELSAGQKRYVQTIAQSGEHLLSLINSILDLSKIEAGKTTLQDVVFDTHDMVGELEHMFELHASEKDIRLIFACDSRVPRKVRGDAVKLRQVLINIVGNAIKFTEDGNVLVSIAPDPAHAPDTKTEFVTLAVEISDSGPGIRQEELDHIFDSFSQSESGIHSPESTGLGLAISREFVRLMGGELLAESKGENEKGATFRFKIDVGVVADDIPNLPKRSREVVTGMSPGGRMPHVLIADDSESNRYFLVHLLNPVGFSVHVVKDGAEAVAYCRNQAPEVILMDMHMPVMDGVTATQEIRSIAKISQPVIIALTANIYDYDQEFVIGKGFNGIIYKPVENQKLFDLIETQLNVNFEYREMEGSSKGAVTELPLVPHLSVLSQETRDRLCAAASANNVSQTKRLIEDIRTEQPDVASRLERFAEDFRYSEIVKALDQIGKIASQRNKSK